MELKKVTDRVYYLPGHVNIGCIVKGSDAILIDTGIDDSTGKKILNTLKNEGLEVKTIINTHSHADHCGGNAFIKEKTGCKIYAPEIEEGVIRYPYMEPLYLFSGAAPVDELTNKFFMARPSHVDYVIKGSDSHINIDGHTLNILPLPGHSPNHTGIEIDGVLFCGDAFVSPALLSKHGIPFNTDIEKQRLTLIYLKKTKYSYYIPSHSIPCASIEEALEANIATLDMIDSSILKKLKTPMIIDNLLKAVCHEYDFTIANIGQYCLLRTALMAHVSSLAKSNKIKSFLEENLLLWQIV